jgi:excisionase family DNA binding protein
MEQHQIPVAPIVQRLLSIIDAATYLGVSPRMVRTWTSTGRLPVIRFGRRVLLDRMVLDRFIESRQAADLAVGKRV